MSDTKKTKKHPLVQYLNLKMITQLLELRFKENCNIREAAERNNMTLALAKKIVDKYGDDYISQHDLIKDLPENKIMVDYWNELKELDADEEIH